MEGWLEEYLGIVKRIEEGSNENNNKIRKQMNDFGSHMIWTRHIKKIINDFFNVWATKNVWFSLRSFVFLFWGGSHMIPPLKG